MECEEDISDMRSTVAELSERIQMIYRQVSVITVKLNQQASPTRLL